MTLFDPALLINETYLSFVCLGRRIYCLHELKYVHLLVTVSGHRCTYGNNFTQCFNIISVIKKIVVQTVEKTFINKLFLKFAASAFRQVFPIQYKKNNTTGSIINRYK